MWSENTFVKTITQKDESVTLSIKYYAFQKTEYKYINIKHKYRLFLIFKIVEKVWQNLTIFIAIGDDIKRIRHRF